MSEPVTDHDDELLPRWEFEHERRERAKKAKPKFFFYLAVMLGFTFWLGFTIRGCIP